MKMRRLLSILALLLALSITLAACGADAPAETPAPETTAGDPDTTVAPGTTASDPESNSDGTTGEDDPSDETADGVTTDAATTDGETTRDDSVVIVTNPAGSGDSETTGEPEEKSPEYVSLGDSIANGYGLQSGEKSYTALLSAEKGYQNTLARCKDGQTSSDLLQALDGLTFNAESTELITVSTGANNILGPAIDVLPLVVLNPAGALSMLYSPEFDAELRAGIAQLEEDLPEIVAKLRTLAPDAEIVLFTVYNPFDGAKIAINAGGGTTDVPLGTMTETYVQLMNAVILEVAEETGCVVADVYTAFSESNEQVVNVTLDENGYITTSIDPHPNAAGHLLIKETVLAALGEE